MRGGRPPRAGAAPWCAGLIVLAALAPPATASATQWPGELSGRIVDSVTRTPLAAVEVFVEPGAWKASTDASGGFRLRCLYAGWGMAALTEMSTCRTAWFLGSR